jgi:succinate dehydrogenase/fumarate reductase flavoprotein subunit
VEGEPVSDNQLAVDLLVIGGGMAGMSAAAYAAREGAVVMVIEKGQAIGGSAVLSGGGLWAPTTPEALWEANPGGDPGLGRVIAERYRSAVDWIRSLGVTVSDPMPMGHIQSFDCVGAMFDVLSYMRRCASIVEDAGGWVITSATVQSLMSSDGRVEGAVIRDAGGLATVRAPWTILATGGFQNDSDLRRTFIGEHAVDMIVRSNPQSSGDGLRLATSVGAALSAHMDRWYGHTIPWPLPNGLHPPDYIRMAQYFMSPRSLLLDSLGRRFIDESVAYYMNAWAVSRLPTGRALLVADDHVRQEDATGQGIGSEYMDRPLEAAKEGAHVVEAPTLAGIAEGAAEWGYRDVERGVVEFNERVVADPSAMTPPRWRNRRVITEPPFFAIEVQPAITFTFGGIRIDESAHVLDEQGRPIPGLLAAGAEVGGMYHEAYGGGLAMSCIFGIQAAQVALPAAAVPEDQQQRHAAGVSQDVGTGHLNDGG